MATRKSAGNPAASKNPQRGSSTAERRAHNPEEAGSTPAPATIKRSSRAASAADAVAKHDWEAVERDYRTGRFTLRELEAKHGPSNATILRRAKREGWTADLSKAVRQATNAALVQQVVAEKCSKTQQDTADTVLAVAELNKAVILKHRKGLREAGEVADDLLDELRMSRMLAEHKELLGQILAGPDAEVASIVQAQQAIAKALGLGSRVDTFKKLAEAITKLHAGERIAFGLDEKSEDDDQTKNPVAAAVADFLSGIHSNRAGRLQHAEPRK